MKSLVIYYSNSGNNKYLAEKIAQNLSCEIEALVPQNPSFPIQLLFSLLRIGTGLKTIKNNLSNFDQIILFGPIWMGQIIAPLRTFIKNESHRLDKLYFVTSCGSQDKERDRRFGYRIVFAKIHQLSKAKDLLCTAFPVGLTLSEDLQNNADAVMKARLTDETFKGPIVDRLNDFLRLVKTEHQAKTSKSTVMV